MAKPDIFNKIADRDKAAPARKARNVVRYRIVYNGKLSAKFYTKKDAILRVKRLLRRGVDAYQSSMSITLYL